MAKEQLILTVPLEKVVRAVGDGKFAVFSHTTGKRLTKPKSKAAASKDLRRIEYFKHQGLHKAWSDEARAAALEARSAAKGGGAHPTGKEPKQDHAAVASVLQSKIDRAKKTASSLELKARQFDAAANSQLGKGNKDSAVKLHAAAQRARGFANMNLEGAKKFTGDLKAHTASAPKLVVKDKTSNRSSTTVRVKGGATVQVPPMHSLHEPDSVSRHVSAASSRYKK